MDALPLRMYISGPGGMEKSHVINMINNFFVCLGQNRQFWIASFMDVAVKNIGSVALHVALSLSANT